MIGNQPDITITHFLFVHDPVLRYVVRLVILFVYKDSPRM